MQGMMGNHRLARAISDAGWGDFARLVKYKQAWRGGQILEADRWFPSTRLCPLCGTVNRERTLADRVFTCSCGYSTDRDLNAAINLARWGQAHHDPHRSPDPKQEAGLPMSADGKALTSTPRVLVKPARMTRKPTFTPHLRPELTTPEEGGAQHSQSVRHAF